MAETFLTLSADDRRDALAVASAATGRPAHPAIAQSVKVGDKVAFDLKLEGGAGEVTAIQKQ